MATNTVRLNDKWASKSILFRFFKFLNSALWKCFGQHVSETQLGSFEPKRGWCP